jgi:hypothetical protein
MNMNANPSFQVPGHRVFPLPIPELPQIAKVPRVHPWEADGRRKLPAFGRLQARVVQERWHGIDVGMAKNTIFSILVGETAKRA